MKHILAIDLSMSCTGWAKLSHTGLLLDYGYIIPRPDIKGISKLKYPRKQLAYQQETANRLAALITTETEGIYIEEINRGINRLAQKSLAGAHWALVAKIEQHLDMVKFIDSDGKDGWRSAKGICLKLNKEDKLFNKKAPKGRKITAKHLAIRYVNDRFNLGLDFSEKGHTDMADAMGIACAAHKQMYGDK